MMVLKFLVGVEMVGVVAVRMGSRPRLRLHHLEPTFGTQKIPSQKTPVLAQCLITLTDFVVVKSGRESASLTGSSGSEDVAHASSLESEKTSESSSSELVEGSDKLESS